MNANGSIRRMDHRDILLNLFLGTEIEGGPANLYLRRLGAIVGGHTAARTPQSCRRPRGSARHDRRRGMAGDPLQRFAGSGRVCSGLVLARGAEEHAGQRRRRWISSMPRTWRLPITGRCGSTSTTPATMWTTRALSHQERGFVLASRQNLSMGGRNPWTVIGALGKGIAYATDALQFHGLATRAGQAPVGLTGGLPGARLQHEHSMVAIQESPDAAGTGRRSQSRFFRLVRREPPGSNLRGGSGFHRQGHGLA